MTTTGEHWPWSWTAGVVCVSVCFGGEVSGFCVLLFRVEMTLEPQRACGWQGKDVFCASVQMTEPGRCLGGWGPGWGR